MITCTLQSSPHRSFTCLPAGFIISQSLVLLAEQLQCCDLVLLTAVRSNQSEQMRCMLCRPRQTQMLRGIHSFWTAKMISHLKRQQPAQLSQRHLWQSLVASVGVQKAVQAKNSKVWRGKHRQALRSRHRRAGRGRGRKACLGKQGTTRRPKLMMQQA